MFFLVGGVGVGGWVWTTIRRVTYFCGVSWPFPRAALQSFLSHFSFISRVLTYLSLFIFFFSTHLPSHHPVFFSNQKHLNFWVSPQARLKDTNTTQLLSSPDGGRAKRGGKEGEKRERNSCSLFHLHSPHSPTYSNKIQKDLTWGNMKEAYTRVCFEPLQKKRKCIKQFSLHFGDLLSSFFFFWFYAERPHLSSGLSQSLIYIKPPFSAFC